MESRGEVSTAALRSGGMAGILAGVFVIVGAILIALRPPPSTLGEILGELFPQNRTLVAAGTYVTLAALLLAVPFLASLYWKLRGTDRALAQLGLGPSLLAIPLLIFFIVADFAVTSSHSNLYGQALADDPTSPLGAGDAGLVLVAYWTTSSLISAVALAAALLLGLGVAFFGIAMRESADFSKGFMWLSVALGILVILFAFLNLDLPAAFLGAALAVAAFALVLGWKIYTLAGTT